MTPTFDLKEETNRGIIQRQISIQDWKIITHKARIFDSKELSTARSHLSHQVPFPDMFFGYNGITIEHSNGFKCSFAAVEAFDQVAEENALKVAISAQWNKSRYDRLELINKIYGK